MRPDGRFDVFATAGDLHWLSLGTVRTGDQEIQTGYVTSGSKYLAARSQSANGRGVSGLGSEPSRRWKSSESRRARRSLKGSRVVPVTTAAEFVLHRILSSAPKPEDMASKSLRQNASTPWGLQPLTPPDESRCRFRSWRPGSRSGFDREH